MKGCVTPHSESSHTCSCCRRALVSVGLYIFCISIERAYVSRRFFKIGLLWIAVAFNFKRSVQAIESIFEWLEVDLAAFWKVQWHNVWHASSAKQFFSDEKTTYGNILRKLKVGQLHSEILIVFVRNNVVCWTIWLICYSGCCENWPKIRPCMIVIHHDLVSVATRQ